MQSSVKASDTILEFKGTGLIILLWTLLLLNISYF